MSIILSVPYLSFFFVEYLLYLFGKINKYNDYIARLLCIIVIVVFVGFRGYIQVDWIPYNIFFQRCPVFFDGAKTVIHFLTQSNLEAGYALYNIIIKSVYNNYFFFQFINVVSELVILHFVFKRYIPKYYILGFLFYFIVNGLFLSIALIRNCKAIMLFLLSIKYLQGRKPIQYFLLNALALTFHASAIFYFPIYFLTNKRVNDVLINAMFFICLVLFFLKLPLATTILHSLSSMGFGGRYGTLVELYIHSSFSSAYGISLGLLERIFSFFLIYRLRKKFYEENLYCLVNMFFIYEFIALWFSDFEIIFGRVGTLFSVSYWFLYPKIYSFANREYKKLFLIIFFTYSVLRIVTQYNEPMMKYENVITGAMTATERQLYLKQNPSEKKK